MPVLRMLAEEPYYNILRLTLSHTYWDACLPTRKASIVAGLGSLHGISNARNVAEAFHVEVGGATG